MTICSRFTLTLSAAALSLALAAPAFAEEMGKGDGMAKPAATTSPMSNDKMSNDKMGKDSMSKDSMSKDSMSKPTTTGAGMAKDDGMKKPDAMAPASGGMSK